MVACGSPEVTDSKESEIEVEPTAKDLIMEDLNNSCQCVDALDMVVDELIVAAESSDSNQVVELTQILHNVEQRCIKDLNISKQEASLCDNFDSVQVQFDVYNKYLKE